MFMSEKALHLPDVHPALEEMSCKAVAKGMDGGMLCDTGFLNSKLDCFLNRCVANMISSDNT